MRLCFPQVLNNVLMDFGLDQINRIFDELRIFCSQCTIEQLNQFKAAKILPEDVNSSGLITRTNAERLCSALLHRAEPPRAIKGALSFKVIHRCFGKCEGICIPDLYTYKDPICIRCLECSGMFSPQRFVCHVHSQQENSTLHWGFDSNNWRAYLQVADDEENREKYSTFLDEIKEKDSLALLNFHRDSNLKRKVSSKWMRKKYFRFECAQKLVWRAVVVSFSSNLVLSQRKKKNKSKMTSRRRRITPKRHKKIDSGSFFFFFFIKTTYDIAIINTWSHFQFDEKSWTK